MASSGPGGSSGNNTESQREAFKVGYLDLSYDNDKTALAGGAQAGTSLANYALNHFGTVAAGGDSAQLPPAVAGRQRVVQNLGANSMNVFPQTGQTINALAANTAIAVAAGKTAQFFCLKDGNWGCILSA